MSVVVARFCGIEIGRLELVPGDDSLVRLNTSPAQAIRAGSGAFLREGFKQTSSDRTITEPETAKGVALGVLLHAATLGLVDSERRNEDGVMLATSRDLDEWASLVWEFYAGDVALPVSVPFTRAEIRRAFLADRVLPTPGS